LWEVGTGHELAELTREPTGIEGLRVTGDGATLIVGTENGRIIRVALNQLDRYVEGNASAWPR
jgi:hypothetical protein